MSRPVTLVDNLYNPRIYGGHTLTASSTAAGTDVLNLSAGRRLLGVNVGGWFASTLNAEAYVESVFDRPRAFDLLFIDRAHNLDGQSVSVRISDDGFTTFQEIGPLTVPSVSTPSSNLYDGQIIRTDEGALLWWLGLQAGYEVRVVFAAMGAGLAPELAGLMLGKTYVPGHAQVKPADYGKPNLLRVTTRSPQAQAAGSEVGRFQSGILHIVTTSREEYTIARYSLEDLYMGGHGMVLLHNDQEAERARFVFAPAGRSGFEIPEGSNWNGWRIPFEEAEPVLL